MKKLLSWLGKLRYNRTENVYFFSLPMSTEAKAGELQRKLIVDFVNKNLGNKTVEFSDFFTDYPNGITYFILASEKEGPFLKPLFYEIYAYTKLKDLTKFSYNYETLIFKETTILKFKIKCYGKKQ
ncbi:MAG: hypothetical protein ABIP51_20645 [Bacteroidia bacterium]